MLLHFSQAAYSPGSKSTCWGHFFLLSAWFHPNGWRQRVAEGPHIPISTTAPTHPGHSSWCYRVLQAARGTTLPTAAAQPPQDDSSTALPVVGLWIRGGVAGWQSQPGHHHAAPGSLTAHFLFCSCSDTKDVIAGAGPGPAHSPAQFTPLLLKPEEDCTHFISMLPALTLCQAFLIQL